MDSEFRMFQLLRECSLCAVNTVDDVSRSSKNMFTPVHWQLTEHGRDMMSENAQQIDYIFALSKLINKKGQIQNLKQVLNSDHFQMFVDCCHNTVKVRKRFQHDTTSVFEIVDGGETYVLFDVFHTWELKGRVDGTFNFGPSSLKDITTGLIHAGDRS